MKHGGDILTYKHLYHGEIIDFSSNINPLGPPKGLKEEILKGFGSVAAYPDIRYRKLKEEISVFLGCSGDEVVVGNGAVEIINNISFMFKRVITAIPCFSEYIKRSEAMGKEVLRVRLKGDFEIDEEALLDTISEGDLVLLGNPNNPTGRRIKKDVLLNIHKRVEEYGAFLLLDEAFYEFCSEDYDSISLLKGSQNTCVIRAATKFFALPGIRLGYAWAPNFMVKKYDDISLPWSVNTFADIAGRVIFKEDEYIEKSKAYIEGEREYLVSNLEEMKSMKVFKTVCNFVLVKLLGGNEDSLFDFLIRRGIMIRKASSFEGLDGSYVRFAIKDRESNAYLIECLKEYETWRK